MKFGKKLKRQMEETIPSWRDKFLAYKDLKKLIRSLSPESNIKEEFICLLNSEIEKFNLFFMEQEEEFIIKQRELKERIWKVATDFRAAEMAMIRKDFVNLHGEMVLLENYSNINYTGVTKILKKYDKRTGGLVRLQFLEKVLQQPFLTTDLISKQIKECEETIHTLFHTLHVQAENGGKEVDTALMVAAEQSIMRNTIAALVTIQELRKGSSSYGQFSIPPMNLPEIDLIPALHLLSPISSKLDNGGISKISVYGRVQIATSTSSSTFFQA